MSTIATVIGLAAAVCTTTANLPQLKKAWSRAERADRSAGGSYQLTLAWWPCTAASTDSECV